MDRPDGKSSGGFRCLLIDRFRAEATSGWLHKSLDASEFKVVEHK
jgi:hypothetical protein